MKCARLWLIIFALLGNGSAVEGPNDEEAEAMALLTSQDLMNLYILKLEEEANYFKSSSPEDEICSCNNCQVCHTNHSTS